jgi:deoxyribonuclease-4
LIGAHVPVASGLVRGGLAHAQAVGAEVVQIFLGNPRGWAPSRADEAADAAFTAACAQAGIPVFVHAPYLINLGSPSPPTVDRSTGALVHTLRRAADIRAQAVVVHAGSAVSAGRRAAAMAGVRAGILGALDQVPGAVPLLIEPTAGGGAALAATLPSLGAYLDQLGRDERIGVCLDTCHLHASGHDLSTPTRMSRVMAAAVRVVAPLRIGLIHANDSRDACGSSRDRHASPGHGTIGAAAFRGLFTGAVRGVPLVVETVDAAHAHDVATLKAWRSGAP